MVSSGFRSSGHFQFSKSKSGWPQQPPTEKVLKSNLRFYDSTPQNFVFKTSKQSWIHLDDSEALSSDFSGLKRPCSIFDLIGFNNLIGLTDLNNLIGLTDLNSHISPKNFLIRMAWSSLAKNISIYWKNVKFWASHAGNFKNLCMLSKIRGL